MKTRTDKNKKNHFVEFNAHVNLIFSNFRPNYISVTYLFSLLYVMYKDSEIFCYSHMLRMEYFDCVTEDSQTEDLV